MSNIRDVLSRKKQQNPQFDFLWRVELPDLDIPTPAMIQGTAGRFRGFGGYGLDESLADPRLQENQFTSVRDKGSSKSSESFLSSITGAAAGVLNSFTDAFASTISDISDINHRVYTVSTPFRTFDTAKVTKGPSFTYNAAQSDIGTLSMVIDEMEDGKTLKYLDKWMNLIEPSNWHRNVPGIYKRDIRYIKMSSGKLDMHYSVYKGYFPTEISSQESSYDSNGVMQYNVTFTGDSVDHIIIPQSVVETLVTAEELNILSQQFASSKLNGAGDNTVRAARVLDNILQNLG